MAPFSGGKGFLFSGIFFITKGSTHWTDSVYWIWCFPHIFWLGRITEITNYHMEFSNPSRQPSGPMKFPWWEVHKTFKATRPALNQSALVSHTSETPGETKVSFLSHGSFIGPRKLITYSDIKNQITNSQKKRITWNKQISQWKTITPPPLSPPPLHCVCTLYVLFFSPGNFSGDVFPPAVGRTELREALQLGSVGTGKVGIT